MKDGDVRKLQHNRQSFLWDADRVHEKASSEVLMDWVLTDNNYGRWVRALRDSIAREALSNEIMVLLNAQHIWHRKTKSIELRIMRMEKKVLNCLNILAKHGLSSLAECGDSLKKQ